MTDRSESLGIGDSRHVHEQTQSLIDRYFDLMGRDMDIAACFTADVTCLVADTGEVVQGPDRVRAYIGELHAAMTGGHTSRIVAGEDNFYLEGDCAALAPDTGNRTHFCPRLRRERRSDRRDVLLRAR